MDDAADPSRGWYVHLSVSGHRKMAEIAWKSLAG